MLKYFLKNRISAFMLISGLVLTGLVSSRELPVSLMPSVESPAISVIIEYPGVDPSKIESVITKPVEKIIKTVEGIEEIYSSSEEGKSRVNITFSQDRDVKICALKVREKIELVKDSFPGEVQDPMVIRYDPSQKPVVIASIKIKGQTLEETRDYVEKKVKPLLQRIEGVSEINISGGQTKEVHVEVDREKLLARGISIPEINTAIQNSNVSLPGGTIDGDQVDTVLYIPGRLESIEDIKNVTVKLSDKGPVKLNEISVVMNSYREKEDMSRHNGEELVSVYIHCAGGANVLEVSNSAVNSLKGIDTVETEIIYNQGEYIKSAVDNAIFSGIWGMVIVFFVIMFFFNSAESVIPIVASIPASMIIVPLFLYFGGKGFNLMSLSGFALAAGMVVDNGVVIIDSVTQSDGDVRSVLKSVIEVRNAVISSTFTTIAVFLPLVFFSKSASDTYGDLAYTITWALVVSLFVSLILVPALYTVFNRSSSNNENMAVVKRISDLSGKFEDSLMSFYKNILNWSMERRGTIITLSLTFLFISMALSTFIKSDTSYDANSREFNLYLEFPTGTSLSKTNEVVLDVEKIVSKDDKVESVSSKIEKWKGTLTVKVLKEYISDKSGLEEKLKTQAQKVMRSHKGFAYTSETMAGAQKEVTIHFLGNDSDILKKTAKIAAGKIKSIDGIDECLLRFREGKPEYSVNIDQFKSGLSKLSNYDISERVRSGLFGPVITKYITEGREVDVRLRYINEQRASIEQLLSGTIKNSNGNMVPLRELTEVRKGKSQTRIYRLKGRRCQSITVKTASLSFQEFTYRLEKVMNFMNFSDEYGWEFDRAVERVKKEKRSLFISVIMSVVIIYMILASLFESLRLPFLIMLTIPLSIVGVILILFLTSTSFTPSVYLGLIVLCGIVVNNGIILVDLINNRLQRKSDFNRSREIIIQSVKSRFRPVLVTSITTILGLFPMMISGGEGSGIWRPFAMTVSSGLLFSTFLTLIVLPVCCDLFYENFYEKILNEEIAL